MVVIHLLFALLKKSESTLLRESKNYSSQSTVAFFSMAMDEFISFLKGFIVKSVRCGSTSSRESYLLCSLAKDLQSDFILSCFLAG